MSLPIEKLVHESLHLITRRPRIDSLEDMPATGEPSSKGPGLVSSTRYIRSSKKSFRRAERGHSSQIQLDIDRLPTRNLGRDDRIISSHSVEARYPYLSLTFIDYLSSLPIETKMDFRFAEPRSDGELALGDKMLLRLAARRLGLEETFGRKKRAMQFGARSAKMEIEHHRRGGTRKGWGGEALD